MGDEAVTRVGGQGPPASSALPPPSSGPFTDRLPGLGMSTVEWRSRRNCCLFPPKAPQPLLPPRDEPDHSVPWSRAPCLLQDRSLARCCAGGILSTC